MINLTLNYDKIKMIGTETSTQKGTEGAEFALPPGHKCWFGAGDHWGAPRAVLPLLVSDGYKKTYKKRSNFSKKAVWFCLPTWVPEYTSLLIWDGDPHEFLRTCWPSVATAEDLFLNCKNKVSSSARGNPFLEYIIWRSQTPEPPQTFFIVILRFLEGKKCLEVWASNSGWFRHALPFDRYSNLRRNQAFHLAAAELHSVNACKYQRYPALTFRPQDDVQVARIFQESQERLGLRWLRHVETFRGVTK